MMELPDEDFAARKLICYRGIARLPLHALNYGHKIVQDKHRKISHENVIRLEKKYEQVGCERLQEENVVNAIVKDDDLIAALSTHGISLDEMCNLRWPQDAPALQIESVQCLSGMHRIEAARRFLNENDKWWVVRLFSYDTPEPVLVRIIESYSNEQKPSDGEIFRKIRLYHRENNLDAEKRWWSHLEKSKPKDLRQLLKRPSLTSGFDALIDMPGLWAKLQLGALHRLLVLKCDEEMKLYLDHIARSWRKILRCGDTILSPSAIDARTVQRLELLSPTHSDIDKSLVMDLMERGEIFSSEKDPSIRAALLENICAFPGVIPSLWTFFETLKYLEPLCEALRQLLGEQMKRTIRSSLTGLFFAPSKNMVQLNETEDVEIKATLSQQEAMMVAYTELWAFCSRHFDGLTASTPRKETGESKPLVKGPNPVVWQHLARFALSRGFRISHAQAITTKQEHYHAQLAIDYLQKAKPMCSNFSDDHVQRVITAVGSDENFDTPEPTLGRAHLSLDRRSGRPFERDFAEEKQVMFFPQLYSGPPCENANLRLVRRDLFSCMFISLDLQENDFGPTINLQVLNQDPKDLDRPVRSPDLNAQYAELQSRYAKLEREYQDISAQREARVEHLENENVDLKGQLQRCSSERQRLDHEFDRFKQHHENCKDAKEQLQELARKWREELAENKKLHSTCAKLRQDLKAALQDPTIDRTPRIVEVPEPLAIESTTVSGLEDSNEAMLGVPPLSAWKPRTGNWQGYEIFVLEDASEEDVLMGYSWNISSSREEAVPQINDSLRQAASISEGKEYYAITVLGKRIVGIDPEILFSSFETCRTLAIGTEIGVDKWTNALAGAAPSPLSYQSTVTIQQATSQALGKTSTILRKRVSGFADEITADGFPNKMSKIDISARVLKPMKVSRSQQALMAAVTSTSTEQPE